MHNKRSTVPRGTSRPHTTTTQPPAQPRTRTSNTKTIRKSVHSPCIRKESRVITPPPPPPAFPSALAQYTHHDLGSRSLTSSLLHSCSTPTPKATVQCRYSDRPMRRADVQRQRPRRSHLPQMTGDMPSVQARPGSPRLVRSRAPLHSSSPQPNVTAGGKRGVGLGERCGGDGAKGRAVCRGDGWMVDIGDAKLAARLADDGLDGGVVHVR